jgi:hypothetical protein
VGADLERLGDEGVGVPDALGPSVRGDKLVNPGTEALEPALLDQAVGEKGRVALRGLERLSEIRKKIL